MISSGFTCCLTIAGSDSCGGAGLQADLKTFAARGVYGMSVVAAVTAQNTQHVTAIHVIPPDIIEKQLEAVLSDIHVDAIKIGMLSSTAAVEAVYRVLNRIKDKVFIVIDPVMIAKAGAALMDQTALTNMKQLLSIATIITPNIPEAIVLLDGFSIQSVQDMETAAKRLSSAIGCKSVLLKGGHLETDTACVDILYDGSLGESESKIQKYTSPRIDTKDTHGTGCTLAACIAAELAKGLPLDAAVGVSKEYVTSCIKHSLRLGHGCGPLNHFWEFIPKVHATSHYME